MKFQPAFGFSGDYDLRGNKKIYPQLGKEKAQNGKTILEK